jgi:ArsR family transcriptional regulator, arsenate/arsenite/antimonite-responsive transcriptional repressor / arsenate reductase (thioredoxin)
MTTEGKSASERAALYAALGDEGRLAIVDALLLGEASPTELQRLLDMPSNLMAHHVRVLERVGLVSRHRSEADRRRTYLALVPGVLDTLRPVAVCDAVRVVFVCTQNSARSQLAAALWNGASPVPATSAGTHPAAAIHPGAVAVARRRGLALVPQPPRHVDEILDAGDVVVTVCDAAHEELAAGPDERHLHWSVADPARTGEDSDFDRAFDALTDRIGRAAPALRLNPGLNPGGDRAH